VDLGVGTAFFTHRCLNAFPKAHVIAIDGASAMISVARDRLGEMARRVDFRIGGFEEVSRILAGAEPVDAVLTSYSLHHLLADTKLDVLRQCLHFLKPGGWFLNADVVVDQNPEVEERIQQIRVNGIVQRAGRRDERFKTIEMTRRCLDELEASEGDQPMTLEADLRFLRTAGYESVSIFWKEYREVVYGGRKSG